MYGVDVGETSVPRDLKQFEAAKTGLLVVLNPRRPNDGRIIWKVIA